MRIAMTLALGALTLVAACDGGDDSGHVHDSGDIHDSGDTAEEQSLTLDFSATVGSEAAACGTDYTLGTANTSAQLADARLFLSNVELENADGDWVALSLTDNNWQTGVIALLDFEDGTAACADSGTTEVNSQITGTLPVGDYSRVRFDVGVPFGENHNDSATAPAPLNTPGMFWVWQGGYKFVRVDLKTADARWNIHVGSTGCVSDAPTAPPTEECGKPNRASITLDIDPLTQGVNLDLAALVASADISTNTPDTAPGCMSGPTEPAECESVFESLGMDFSTGACDGECADQSVFGAVAR